jgi:hypothetical protein
MSLLQHVRMDAGYAAVRHEVDVRERPQLRNVLSQTDGDLDVVGL